MIYQIPFITAPPLERKVVQRFSKRAVEHTEHLSATNSAGLGRLYAEHHTKFKQMAQSNSSTGLCH